MENLTLITQIVIALGIANVWLVRFGKPTAWRGGSANNMREEFQAYGLPAWSVRVIGFLKLTCAALLVAGIWVPGLARPAAIGLAALMLGAIAMHVRIKDPLSKSIPATTMLALCAIVIIA
jgi:uncharacterized membrane protein YphA (DoxX/SURF4 family)